MAKVVTSGVVLVFDGTQSDADVMKVDALEVDPFQTKQGYRIKAVEFRLDPAIAAAVSASASMVFQFWAASVAPTEQYDVFDRHVIAQVGRAVSVVTSGAVAIPVNDLWTPPYPGQIDVGSLYMGCLLASDGMDVAIGGSVFVYGDVVTLTTDEQNASRAFYT